MAEPGLVSETCAVTPNNRSCSVSRNPVFIDSAITSVATPAATPRIENKVTSRRTAGRYGDRKYRRATNHSNRMVVSREKAESHERPLYGHCEEDTLRAARFGSGVVCFGTKKRKKNDVANGL